MQSFPENHPQLVAAENNRENTPITKTAKCPVQLQNMGTGYGAVNHKREESMKDEVVKKKKIEPVFGMFGIEPVVILINLGRCMIGVQISNLYIEKTCKVCNILQ